MIKLLPVVGAAVLATVAADVEAARIGGGEGALVALIGFAAVLVAWRSWYGDEQRKRESIQLSVFVALVCAVSWVRGIPEKPVTVQEVDAFEKHLIVSAAIWHLGDPENPWVIQVLTDQGRRTHDQVVAYSAEYLRSLPSTDVHASSDTQRWSRCLVAATEVLSALR